MRNRSLYTILGVVILILIFEALESRPQETVLYSESTKDTTSNNNLAKKYIVNDLGNCLFVLEEVYPNDSNYSSGLTVEEANEKKTNLNTVCLGTSTTTAPKASTTKLNGELSVEMVCLNTQGKNTSATIAVSVSNSTDKLYGFNVTISPGYNENFYIGRVEKGLRKTMTFEYEYDAQESSASGKNYFTAKLYSVYTTNASTGETTEKLLTQCTFDRNYSNGQTSAASTTTTSTTTTSTTTTVAKTTTTTEYKSPTGFGGSVFETSTKYHWNILNMTLADGMLETGYIIPNGWENKKGCNEETSGRGCRALLDNFPSICCFDFSQANDGGKRAFGSVVITVLNEIEIIGVSVDMIACRKLDRSCLDGGYDTYEVYLTDFRKRYRNLGETTEYWIDLVGEKAWGAPKDQSFFYPGYYYIVDTASVQILDTSDPLRWNAILEIRTWPGVGSYIWQVGYDAPVNLGVVDNTAFMWSTYTYDGMPYYSP
tara:strand:+ start:307 stop:1761 length:1455 start_codon:yes stop_codon:yes gene_type:complete